MENILNKIISMSIWGKSENKNKKRRIKFNYNPIQEKVKLKQIINSVGEGDLPDELVNGIIVEKYNPPEHESVIIKDENSKIEKVISEYGIYGIILMNDNNLVINKSVSFLIKTGIKGESLDIYDLPCLVETKIEPNLIHKVEVKAEEIQKYLDDLKAAEEEKKKKEEEEKKRAYYIEAQKKLKKINKAVGVDEQLSKYFKEDNTKIIENILQQQGINSQNSQENTEDKDKKPQKSGISINDIGVPPKKETNNISQTTKNNLFGSKSSKVNNLFGNPNQSKSEIYII